MRPNLTCLSLPSEIHARAVLSSTSANSQNLLKVINCSIWVFAPAVVACQKGDDTFPTITPHDLRHTAASLAISARANVKAVQRMLGHAEASMTLDTYADLFDTDLDAVAVELDAAIRAVAGKI